MQRLSDREKMDSNSYRFVDIDTVEKPQPPTSEDIEEKGRELIAEMKILDQDSEMHDAKKEEIRAHIFQQMIDLSEQIHAHHVTGTATPFMKEFYWTIRQKPIQAPIIYTDRLAMYRDKWHMFRRVDPSLQSVSFWKRMAVDLGGLNEKQVHNVLIHPNKDGLRRVFMMVMNQCDRKNYIENKEKYHCKDCWKSIMKESLVHLAQVTLIHAREMMEKVKQSMEQHKLNHQCGAIVLKTVTQSVLNLKKVLKSVKKCKSMKEWNKHVEEVFQLNIEFENQLLDSLMQCASERQQSLM